MYLLLDGPLNGQYATLERAAEHGYVGPDYETRKAWDYEAILMWSPLVK